MFAKLKQFFAAENKYSVTDLSEARKELAEETLCRINKQLTYYYEYHVISPKECIFDINCIMMAYLNKYNKIINNN